MEDKKGIIYASLDEVFKNSMVPYAEDVILDRALPRVEDGLKPVQRRILYAMYEMGLTSDKPHKKCAKIVGDCLGRYHPHGDSSVYGALVHLAQTFNMRMPLIDGHGNFGTVDGDSAAAYRYTEARLESLSLELLRDIEKNTVNFNLNFDDTLEEPETLPGRFPNLLVNGATGIAVGLATNIPPHNLGEVINGAIAYIDNNKISLKEMMTIIKGPDFPTGGYVICDDELTEAYKTGRGKIKIRARVTVESVGEKKNLIISELPYQVNKAVLLKKISDLSDEKKDELGGIADVVDESDRNGMRAVIKLRKDADSKKILKYLFKNTDLEISYGINMVAIADAKPRQLGLLDILDYYVKYQKEVILKRCKYDLEKAKERANILEGLIIAVKNIDEVIKIIKGADNTTDAKQKLMKRFSLSESQAQAILDLRLAKLTKLEVTKLEEELKEIKALIEKLTAIIADKKLQWDVVKTELKEIKKKYADDRRTNLVIGGEEVKEDDSGNNNDDNEYENVDDFIIAISDSGLIKKVTEKNYKSNLPKLKDRDTIFDYSTFTAKTKSNESVILFTDQGNALICSVSDIVECRFKDKGVKITEISKEFNRSEKVVSIIPISVDEKYEDRLLFITKDGLVKYTNFAEFKISKTYFNAIKLKDNDSLLTVQKEIKDTTLAFITKDGICLNMRKDDIPVTGRVAGGVKGLNLGDKDSIVFSGQVDEEGEFIIITDSGCYKKTIVAEFEVLDRARKGIKICDLCKDNKIVYAGYVKEPFDLIVVDNFGVAFNVNSEDISIENRTTKGKTLKNENKKRIPDKVFELR